MIVFATFSSKPLNRIVYTLFYRDLSELNRVALDIAYQNDLLNISIVLRVQKLDGVNHDAVWQKILIA